MQEPDKDSELPRGNDCLQQRVAELEGALHEHERNAEELLSAQEALRESEAKYRLLFDANLLLIAWVDSFERYQAINSKYSMFFGIELEEVLGKYIWEILGKTIYGHLKDRISQAMQGMMVEYEENIPDKKGQIHYLHGRLVPYHPSKDVQDGFVVFVEDITERKKAEAEQENLQKQLIQSHKMEAVGQLAGGVAHDFNNLLSVILGHAELGLMREDPMDKLLDRLQYILKAAESAKGVTRQLMAFARKQTVAPKVLNLNESVDGMFKMLWRLIGEDIELVLQPGSNLWALNIDPSQIDQVLVNLCVNAKDAIEGVGKIVIETKNMILDYPPLMEQEEFVPGEYVLLSVRDDGCGMDDATIAKIFDPFFTTKPLHQGTGMGLSSVYGIIKQNKGFINVHSEIGKGTTFEVYFPRHMSGVDEINVGDVAKESQQGNNEIVLLVEDEIDLLKLTKEMLESLGYIVLEAASPTQALSLAERHAAKINLLITDVVMPEMNGRELADRLQTLNSDIEILFMSGYTADVIAHRGVVEKNMNFIAKPFFLEDLSTKVREALKCQ